ncbi:two-component system, OmpR family, sensor histidine kinase MtrB [Frankineae bacterium MT45]|nr:two-component system, OmpR family, sensor histidine kinase MtrB [Frankineae bacterium MT45]
MNAFAERIAALRSPQHPTWRALGSRASQLANRLRQTWSRSLQLRVGVTTATVTSVVVILVGVFLVNQISAGILRAKRDAAIAQANTGLQTAQRVLSGVGVGDVAGVSAAVDQIQASLTATGPSAGLFTIEIESTSAPLSTPQSETGIPIELRRLVQGGNLAVQYSLISQPSHRDPVPGLIVGEPISAAGGVFELYYLFALTAEQSTISLVQRTVLISGIVLVIFISGIAYLVTRQVVRPVQVAAATAARLAAGDLSQRIPVHGTDDIALLGQSFNDMAGSLQGQIRRLEDLSRLQQRFTSDVSHELRTPLTTIRMATELLHSERAEFAPVLARSVELLLAELDRFEALLADLLEISRYDAGVARLDSEQTDLRGVLANAVAASNTLAQRHGVELVVDVPASPVLVEMDARRVERILRNLIGNALDHADGRPVVATVAADEHSAAVAVRDHGVGLRPGEAALVFNRFWRGDPSRSRLTGGTGLGLAISLEDARLHGGWLQAWGERGLGAQFRLTLPLKQGETLVSSPLPLEPEALIEFDVRQDR